MGIVKPKCIKCGEIISNTGKDVVYCAHCGTKNESTSLIKTVLEEDTNVESLDSTVNKHEIKNNENFEEEEKDGNIEIYEEHEPINIKKTDTIKSGTVSIIFGILSLIVLPIILGIIGIVAGFKDKGETANKIGIVLNIIGIIAGFIAFLIETGAISYTGWNIK